MEVVKVCGMMHLLVSGHFETTDSLYQTIEHVYRNFTCIHKATVALFDDVNATGDEEWEIGLLNSFCRCSLRRITEEDGITIRQTHARLLAAIELYLVTVCKACAAHLPSNCSTKFVVPDYLDPGMLERIGEAYYEPSPINCYRLIVNYDLMMEFLDQCAKDFSERNLKESVTVLRNYLEYTKDGIHGDNLEKLMIAVENAAYEMSRFYFSEVTNRRTGIQPEVFCFTLLKVLQADVSSSTATHMSDELVIGYVKCVQDNLYELLKKHPLTNTLKCQLKIFQEGFSFLIHLIFTYPPRHNYDKAMISNIRLDFEALMRNTGSVICSCFENPEIDETSLELFDLTEKANVIEGDIIKTICCMVLQDAEREYPKKDQPGSLILLLQKVKKFMDCKPSLVVIWKDHENLVLFITYLIQNNHTDDDEVSGNAVHSDAALINPKELNEVLISAQVVAFNMACCSLLRRYMNLCWWKLYFLTEDSVDFDMRLRILRAIVLSCNTPLANELLIAYAECVRDSLIELLSDEVFDAVQDQFNILHEMVAFLGRLLISYEQEQENLAHIKVDFQNLVRNIGSVICSHFNNRATKICISELSKLVEKMNPIIVGTEELLHREHLGKIGRESPKTYQLGSLDLLLQNWDALMDGESDLLITWTYHFKMIHENLVLLKSFMTSSCSEDDESKDICNSIMDAGHKAEYLVNTFYVGTCPERCRGIWIIELTKQVEIIKAAVMNANKEKGNMKEFSTTRKDQTRLSSQTLLFPTSTDGVVGFEVEMKLIRERLTGPKQNNVISIFGMPGLGKSTLARKVYEDKFTVNYFDARVWCCISKEYNKKSLLVAILDSISELTDDIKGKSETDLSVMVHKQLMGRRYFIVLDDIWDINVFMYLKCFFPDENNGSRIVLTSRSKEIGLQAHCKGNLIEPRVLTDEQSWDLLERKVYNKGKCPPQLCHIGKEIAKSCKGLPLAVVVVGGVLATRTNERDFWEQVQGNLTSYLARDSHSQFLATLELSYAYLPDCLKPMFLYLGAFPEDREIHVDNLIRLWIAEGFVQTTEFASLEIQAETHLMDLIDRSLVMVAKRRWDGRVKVCNVHDLLRDMCLAKAEEENFMQQVHVHNNKLPAYPVMYQRRLSILFQGDDTETTSRHLVAYKDLPKFSIIPPIYTVLYFQMEKYTFSEDGLGDIIFSLKLLKVFDAQSFLITQDLLDKALSILVHLRYARFTYKHLKSIPSSVSRLRSLETLIIEHQQFDSGITVPETIWEMTKLRHLHIPRGRFSAPLENPFILENLQTFSDPSSNVGELEKIFKKIPGVKKLRCRLYQRKGNKINHPFPDLESLSKLESLKLTSMVENGLTGEWKLPCTLKELTLFESELNWSQISMLKTLPNLEVLNMRHDAVDDDETECWDMGDDDVFTKLKVLTLYSMRIERWIACAGNFPCLEKLELDDCMYLAEIPSDLGEIETLRFIKVYKCHKSAGNIAKEIQKEQEEFDNQLLKFDIRKNDNVHPSLKLYIKKNDYE